MITGNFGMVWIVLRKAKLTKLIKKEKLRDRKRTTKVKLEIGKIQKLN